MIKYLVLAILLLSNFAMAATGINLEFDKVQIQQGSLEDAKIVLKADAVQRIELQKLKGQNLADTIYIYDVSPLVRKEGSDFFYTNAKVIFAKVPESNALTYKLGTEDILFTWGNAQILPTEVEKGFIFGKFEIPSRPKILLWLSILVGVLVLGCVIYWAKKKFALKSEIKRKKKALKTELLTAANYTDVVEVWKKKQKYFAVFPQIEDEFKQFEIVLFKYQFKPRQTEAEMNIVSEAYRDFLRKIEGGLSGV